MSGQLIDSMANSFVGTRSYMSVSTDLSPDSTALTLLGLTFLSSGDQTRTSCCCSWFSSSCIPGIFWCHIRLCVWGKNCCKKNQKLGIFVAFQRSWGCACTAEPSQTLPLGVVSPRKSQCLWFVFLGKCGSLPTPAFAGDCSHIPAWLQQQGKPWEWARNECGAVSRVFWG